MDALKIAKPFVDELGTSSEQDRLVAAILRLGATMGLETVAEGIELEEQRDRLRAAQVPVRPGVPLLAPRARPTSSTPMLVSARVA